MNVRDLVRFIDGPLFALEDEAKALTVIEVLDRHFQSIKINKQLGKRLYHYQIGYVNTSRDYVEFFGSNLLGVQVIRFREADVLRFFNEILEIDYQQLEQDIRQTTVINHTYKVSGDIFNLTVMYLVHRCLAERSLGDHDRFWLAQQAALIFFYRATAALLSAYFIYPADPKVAQAAYANLSFKFLIKKLGSWHKVMEYRANELISKSGVQYNKLVRMGNDLDLVDVINDSANAIKDMIKNYYSEFVKVHAQGVRISTTKSTGLDIEGEEVLRDKVRSVDKQIALIKHYLNDTNAFVREDLIRVISDINRNTSARLIRDTLHWVSGHVEGKDHKLIDDVVTRIVIYSNYLIETRIEPSKVKDIGYVLIQLKNLYLSSRSTDPDLMKIRELTDKVIGKAHEELSTALLLATRTAFILYITFRVLVGTRSS